MIFHFLHQPWFIRVEIRVRFPIFESIFLNSREFLRAIEARDVEQSSKNTNITTRISTPSAASQNTVRWDSLKNAARVACIVLHPDTQEDKVRR